MFGTLFRRQASHPTRVRGLKCGAGMLQPTRIGVAPHPGAWIEIAPFDSPYLPNVSHPTRVRGLKLLYHVFSKDLVRSHPTRVRGLKLCVQA